jgi:hypothetical protein
LISVTVQKTILSSADSISALKFFDMGTKAFEAEAGLTINEPGTYAVKAAVEMGVVELIKEGKAKGIWDYKQDTGPTPPAELPKVEEKKDVVVQSQTKSETKTQAVPSATAEVKADLFGTRVLKEDAYLYKEADDKSQRTWQLKKGTELTIISPGPEGWHLVRDAEKRKGFVKQDVLTNKPQ